MSRPRPAPQNRAVPLNLSVPLRVADAVQDAAEAEGVKVSVWATKMFMQSLGMK